MKKIQLILLVIALCCFSGPALGQWDIDPPNEIGIYADPNGNGQTSISPNPPSVTTLYFIVFNPTDLENGGQPMGVVKAFEFSVHTTATSGVDYFQTGYGFTNGGINISTWPDLVVGLTEPIEVTPYFGVPQAMLGYVEFFVVTTNRNDISLRPSSLPGLPGKMGIVGDSGLINPMYPISGSHEAPVFSFYGQAVAVENESYGSVKAMYR